MKFKPGDKVRCITSSDYTSHHRISNVIGDNIYTVEYVRSDLPEEEVGLVEFPRQGSFYSRRFELVEEPKKDMSVAPTGGLRDNKGKPKLSTVPSSLTKAVAQVIYKSSVEGGGKYPMHNWRKGLPWTDVADSAMRHIQDFLDRKDIDKESGLHTLYHAATNLAFLIEYLETCPELDNRYEGKNASNKK